MERRPKVRAKTRFTARQIAVAGMLGAVVGVLGLTPVGMVPVPTPAGSVTILHISVIIAALIEGPWIGAMVGFFFGFISWWRAVTAPANPVAQIMFSDIITAFGPRIFIGPAAFGAMVLARRVRVRPVVALVLALALGDAVFRTLAPWNLPGAATLGILAAALAGWTALRLLSRDLAGPALAAVVGTLTNTVGVLYLVVLRGVIPAGVALGVGVVHGIPEIIVAVALTVLVYRGLRRVNLAPDSS